MGKEGVSQGRRNARHFQARLVFVQGGTLVLFVRGHLGAVEPGVLGVRPSHGQGQPGQPGELTPSNRAASSQLSGIV